jgi:hypothetical protein
MDVHPIKIDTTVIGFDPSPYKDVYVCIKKQRITPEMGHPIHFGETVL